LPAPTELHAEVWKRSPPSRQGIRKSGIGVILDA